MIPYPIKRSLLLSLILLTGISQALAESNMEQLLSLSLEDLIKVKVTGSTRQDESLKSVPSPVTVFTHQQIKRLGADYLDELMGLVPGFQTFRSSSSPVAYTYSARGHRSTQNSTEILILLDGIRLVIHRNGGILTRIPKFSLDQVQRVEFIRGPGSAMYGTNAHMGVINIVSLKGQNKIKAGYGSLNRKHARLQTSTSQGAVDIDLYAAFDRDDGERYKVQDTFSSSTNIVSTKDPRKTGDTHLQLSWNQSKLHLFHGAHSAEDFYVQADTANDLNEVYGEFNSLSFEQGFNWFDLDSNVFLTYTATSAYKKLQVTAPGALVSLSSPSSTEPLLADFKFREKESRIQWHNDWAIEAQQSLQFGAEYRYIKSPETKAGNNFDVGDLVQQNFPLPFYDELLKTTTISLASEREVLGFYSQYLRTIFKHTELTAGLRYDNISSVDHQLSQRLGLVHHLDDVHSVKLLYGTAFRAPTEHQLNLVNNPIILGNQDIKAEVVKSWDLIWLGQWSDLYISLGYFQHSVDDAITQTIVSGSVRQWGNTDIDNTKGFEGEFSYELVEGWLFRATHTRLAQLPDESFREADTLSSLLLNYQYGRWNGNIAAIYNGERESATGGDFSNRILLDDYWLVYGKISYALSEEWQTELQVKNLFDRNYSTPAQNAGLIEGISNRDSEILVRVIWNF